jgi:hypothetical protein
LWRELLSAEISQPLQGQHSAFRALSASYMYSNNEIENLVEFKISKTPIASTNSSILAQAQGTLN